MKTKINKNTIFRFGILLFVCVSFQMTSFSQAIEPAEEKAPRKSVKNTFEGVWIIDNQTVMVPGKGTFEFDILHRFGKVNNGFRTDLYGLFAPSNIRLGLAYAPINNLNLGLGLTKERMILDGSIKYAIIKQTKDSWAIPLSISYYGNMSYDMQKDEDNALYRFETDRLRFFNQLIFARKISNKLSIQVAPSISHQNFVNGYFVKTLDSLGFPVATNEVAQEMEFDHWAIAFSGRYKITEVTSILLSYDQPITKHTLHNPNPNLSFGFEFNTSGHAFQVFAGNYSYLNHQRNNLENRNAPVKYKDSNGVEHKGGNFLIGFNITRLWN